MASGINPAVHPPGALHGGWPVDRVPYSHTSNYHYTPTDIAAVSNDIHSWEAGGRGAPNVQREFQDFYGLNLYQKADQRPKPQEKYDMPEAYTGMLTGRDGIVSRAIIKLITLEQQWPVREVLPWKQHEGSLSVGWDEFHFNDHSLTETPHEVPPRLLTSEKIGHQEALKRFGLAMLLEHDFMKTPEGRLQYKMNMQQIANAVLNTCIHGAMIALVTSTYNPKNIAMTMYNQKFNLRDFKEFLATQKEFFGILQKSELGAAAVVDFARDVLAQRNNFDADTLIVPEGAAKFCAFTHAGANGGLDGSSSKVDPHLSILSNTTDSRKFKVFESSKIATGDGGAPHDPLYRPRSHGEHYLMTDKYLLSVPDSLYRSSMMTIKVFDEDRNAIVQISPYDVWEAARPPPGPDIARDFDPRDRDHSMEEQLLAALVGGADRVPSNLYEFLQDMNGQPWLREWVRHIAMRIVQGSADADVPAGLQNLILSAPVPNQPAGGNNNNNGGANAAAALPGIRLAPFEAATGVATIDLQGNQHPDFKLAGTDEKANVAILFDVFSCDAKQDDVKMLRVRNRDTGSNNAHMFFAMFPAERNEEKQCFIVVASPFTAELRGEASSANEIIGSDSILTDMQEGFPTTVQAEVQRMRMGQARVTVGGITSEELLDFENDPNSSKQAVTDAVAVISTGASVLAAGSGGSSQRKRRHGDVSGPSASQSSSSRMRESKELTVMQNKIVQGLHNLQPIKLFKLTDLCIQENARPPVAFLILQPHITHLMGSAIVCKRGPALGNTLWGHVDFQLADNVALKMHYGNFTMYTKPLVFDPSKLVVIPDVFSRRYMGGGGTKFYRVDSGGGLYTDSDLYLYKDSMQGGGKDMFACIVPATFEPEEDFDITGAFCNVEAERDLHYPTALVYAQYWGWTRAPNDVANLSFVDFGNCPRNYNSTVSKGFQVSLCNDGNTPLFQPGHGCWGNRVYDGCGTVRKGYAGVLRPVDYNNTQTFMVEKAPGFGIGV